MIVTETRPLSELYSADVARIIRLERGAINIRAKCPIETTQYEVVQCVTRSREDDR